MPLPDEPTQDLRLPATRVFGVESIGFELSADLLVGPTLGPKRDDAIHDLAFVGIEGGHASVNENVAPAGAVPVISPHAGLEIPFSGMDVWGYALLGSSGWA